jgi:MFS family permease
MGDDIIPPCSTVVVPIYGKHGDLYGRKYILLFGIVILRAIQGLESPALFSLSFTIIADLFTPRERG